MKMLQDAKRILFLGDSITASGGYVVDFETWAAKLRLPHGPIMNMGLSSETVSGLSEAGHAGGKFPRPDLFERLDRVLETSKPDLVFACYGMNCGIYQPLDEARFAKFREGMTKLKAAVEKAGGKLIVITPPNYDATKHPDKKFYDGVLAAYSDWLNERARKDGWMVVDLHKAMTDELMLKRRTDPKFAYSNDGVHPSKEGHWFIASRLIGWFGDDRAAAATSAAEMRKIRDVNDDAANLIAERSGVIRDAYVAAAGHKRPGVAKGLPLEEALKRSAALSESLFDALGGVR